MNYKKTIKSTLENVVLKKGKKNKSEKIIKSLIKLCLKKNKKKGSDLLKSALLNTNVVFRNVENQSHKKSKKSLDNYTPVFISKSKSRTVLALKWITQASTKSKLSRKESFYSLLLEEFLNVSGTENSEIFLKINDIHQKVLKKKKYARKFRW